MQPNERPLLFVTWDSDKSNYLECLFFPILHGIHKQGRIPCHVIQFSWAGEKEVKRIREHAKSLDIVYGHRPVLRKPNEAAGALWTVWWGSQYLRRYIERHRIGVVLPRSTMPAMMINRLSRWLVNRGIDSVFDADGFPIEERIDYASLNPKGIRYKLLKNAETKITCDASMILTRSHRAVSLWAQKTRRSHSGYVVVSNGRDQYFFQRNIRQRDRIRKGWGLDGDTKLWVYSGSLGPQYMVEEMLLLFDHYQRRNPDSRFLLLTRDSEYLSEKIPETIASSVKIIEAEFKDLPVYLSAADVALCLRKQAPSLAGIAPIKLGEYLMMELPVILSPGIGDSASALIDKDFCYMYDSSSPNRFREACRWVEGFTNRDLNGIREFALENFSLEKSISEYLQALKNLH